MGRHEAQPFQQMNKLTHTYKAHCHKTDIVDLGSGAHGQAHRHIYINKYTKELLKIGHSAKNRYSGFWLVDRVDGAFWQAQLNEWEARSHNLNISIFILF